MDSITTEHVNQWLSLDKNPRTIQEVNELIKDAKFEELSKIMNKRIQFGTAGIC